MSLLEEKEARAEDAEGVPLLTPWPCRLHSHQLSPGHLSLVLQTWSLLWPSLKISLQNESVLGPSLLHIIIINYLVLNGNKKQNCCLSFFFGSRRLLSGDHLDSFSSGL